MTLPLSPLGRRYGFRPSLPDAITPRFKITSPVPIPPAVDLTPYLGTVRNQANLGKCTGSSASGYLEYLYRFFKKLTPVFSDVDLYYKERQMDGDLGEGDTGSFGGTAVKVINQFGVCEQSVETRTNDTFELPPTQEQIDNAAKWKAGAYHAMSTIDEMKHCIASFYPVLYGFSVYESFEDGKWTDRFIMPKPEGPLYGGHENFFKQYVDDFDCGNLGVGAFSSRNSWGPEWGINGDFWMPYSIVESVLSEARMQHFGKPW